MAAELPKEPFYRPIHQSSLGGKFNKPTDLDAEPTQDAGRPCDRGARASRVRAGADEARIAAEAERSPAVILVDVNVLMYAAGVAHDHKAASVRFLERVAEGEIDAVIDAEILQEILHRYRALDRWQEGRRLFDLTRVLFPVVLPVTAEVMDRARILLETYPHLMAREGLHAAVVLQHQLDGLCSFDRDFDAVAGVERVEP